MNTKGNCYLFLTILSCMNVSAWEIPSSTAPNQVRFFCDEAEFHENEQSLFLKGNVRVDEITENNFVSRRFKGNEFHINLSSKIIFSPDELTIEEQDGSIHGKKGMFNYQTNSGWLHNGTLNSDQYIIRARDIKIEKNRQVFKKSSITTCDFKHPHYKIKSSKISLKPHKSFLAYHNLFYLGKIPLLYFPILYKPLGKETPWVSSFRLGYDERNGFSIKSTFMYKFNPMTRGKLFLDYFSENGFGTGGEIDYNNHNNNKTNFSFYRIKEYSQPHERWGINGGYWHKFNVSGKSAVYYSQSYFRLVSDPKFNNDFFRSNPFAISADKEVNASVTRQTNLTVTRLSFQKRYDTTDDYLKFRQSYESSPRIDFQTAPVKILKSRFLNTFSGSFENVMETNTDYFQKKGNANWTISDSFKLVRNITLSPSVFYNESVQFSTSSANKNVWIGRYGTNINLRYSRLWGTFDLTHSYHKRLKINRFEEDVSSVDNGVEKNSVSPNIFIRPSKKLYMRTTTSYDLRKHLKSLSERMSPLIFEFVWTPKNNLNLYVKDVYDVTRGNKSFLTQFNIGDTKNYLGFGMAHHDSNPNDYIFNHTVGYSPKNSSWQIESIIRYKITAENFNFKTVHFFEKSLLLHKDFHDFSTKWKLTIKPDVRDFSFLINLKFTNLRKNLILDKDSDKFWYPWRKQGEERD